MSNSTAEFWDADGVSLNTFAFNITTLGGDRMAPPPLRGDDITIPASPGQRWMPKMVDGRTITLGMWVIGAEEDGTAPVDGNRKAQFDENWRKLRNLLWTYDREIVLTKRFYVGGVLKTASARAAFAGGLNPKMDGQQRAAFTVDLYLADPYFYSAVEVETLSASETVTLEGDDVTRAVTFEIVGARDSPTIRNDTLDVQFQYNADIPTLDQVDIDVKAYTSTTYPDGGSAFNSAGSILHSGSPSWFMLRPGTNLIEVTSDSGIGVVTMSYQEVWL
jgi:hypothetical protein